MTEENRWECSVFSVGKMPQFFNRAKGKGDKMGKKPP